MKNNNNKNFLAYIKIKRRKTTINILKLYITTLNLKRCKSDSAALTLLQHIPMQAPRQHQANVQLATQVNG